MSPVQLPLGFIGKENYRREDFAVTPANQAAWAWVQAWPQGWLSYGGCVVGPEGAGKTHLLDLWRQRADAACLTTALREGVSPSEAAAGRKHWMLDGIEPWLTSRKGEEPLFHWLNAIKEVGGSVLISARQPIANLRTLLPDVRSRLLQFPVLEIGAPDDRLLQAVLRKQLGDRQLLLAPEVEAFLLARMERSFAAVKQWVETMDRVSLSRQKPVTVPMVRELMGEREVEAA